MYRFVRRHGAKYSRRLMVRRRGRRPPPLRRFLWQLLTALYPLTWATWWTVDGLHNATHAAYLRAWTPYGMIRLRPATYRGAALVLRDGTRVTRGSAILEMHINSPVARALQRRGVNPYRAAEADLTCLGYWLDRADTPYVAVRSRNILRDFMRHLCADVMEGPRGPRGWLEQLFEEMAILIFHPLRIRRLQRAYTPIADAWYSRREFAGAPHR